MTLEELKNRLRGKFYNYRLTEHESPASHRVIIELAIDFTSEPITVEIPVMNLIVAIDPKEVYEQAYDALWYKIEESYR